MMNDNLALDNYSKCGIWNISIIQLLSFFFYRLSRPLSDSHIVGASVHRLQIYYKRTLRVFFLFINSVNNHTSNLSQNRCRLVGGNCMPAFVKATAKDETLQSYGMHLKQTPLNRISRNCRIVRTLNDVLGFNVFTFSSVGFMQNIILSQFVWLIVSFHVENVSFRPPSPWNTFALLWLFLVAVLKNVTSFLSTKISYRIRAS